MTLFTISLALFVSGAALIIIAFIMIHDLEVVARQQERERFRIRRAYTDLRAYELELEEAARMIALRRRS